MAHDFFALEPTIQKQIFQNAAIELALSPAIYKHNRYFATTRTRDQL